MENKTKEELTALVAAQVAVNDRLTLELAARQPLADSFVAKPDAGELPPLPEPWITDMTSGTPDHSRRHYAEDQMLEYGRQCRTSQPVQQPAAVGEVAAKGRFTSNVDWFAGYMPPVGTKLYTAPVPAAGVQGERIELARQVIDDTNATLAEQSATMRTQQQRIIELEARLAAPVQPDSGRDAALVDALVEAGREYGNSELLRGIIEELLAAHPAPSSDAARGDACFTPYENEQHRVIKALQKKLIEMQINRNEWKKIAETEAEARIAAHPANGAQAGLSDITEAFEFAAQVVELFDDATMQADYMIDAGEAAGIIRALPGYLAAPQKKEA